MNKNFGFNAGSGRDVGDFLQRQFAREHHAREAHCLQRFSAGAIVNSQLRAGVQFQFRKVFSNYVVNAQVLDDQRVHANFAHRSQRVDQFAHFALKNQRVDRDKNTPLALHGMRERRDRVEVFDRKILRFRTRRKLLQPQINRVRAVVKCRVTRVQPTRRRQQFDRMARRFARDQRHAERRLTRVRIVLPLRRIRLRRSLRRFHARKHRRQRHAIPRRRALESIGRAASGR